MLLECLELKVEVVIMVVSHVSRHFLWILGFHSLLVYRSCILHNYVRKTEGLEYTSIHIDDHEIVANENYVIPPTVQNTISININSSANVLRNYLANYFINPRAALPWQWKYCCWIQRSLNVCFKLIDYDYL